MHCFFVCWDKVTAGILANRKKLTWRTKEGEKSSNYFGSVTQASTVQIGTDASGSAVYVPMKNLMPMVNPNDLVIGGWDISGMNLGDAMRRSAVLDVTLQDQLYEEMSALKPMPSIYFPDFIAANQADRADNVLVGSTQEQMDKIREDIRGFRQEMALIKSLFCGLLTPNGSRTSRRASTTPRKISWMLFGVGRRKSLRQLFSP